MRTKRIFSAILCAVMLLSTMSTVAFASDAGAPSERTFVVAVDKTTCVIGENLKVTVKLQGTDLVGATWTLNYDATKFELLNGENTGTINGAKFINDEKHAFEAGEILAEYEFKAIVKKPDGLAASFTVTNGDAWTISEAIEGDTVITANVIPAAVTPVDPDYLVEVDMDNDYVAGKKLILVYTNSPYISFGYDGATMYDVSSKYIKEGYKYSYAIVSDAIENGALADYKADVAIVYNTISSDFVISYDKDNYNYDLNGTDSVNLRDVTLAYGVFNCNETVYSNMDIVLNTDINADGVVDSIDTTEFVSQANKAN